MPGCNPISTAACGRIAAERGIALDTCRIRLVNHYWLTGSFIHGTGEGHAEAPDIEVQVHSAARPRDRGAGRGRHGRVARDRLRPRAARRQHLRALYQRSPPAVAGVANSQAPDAGDPYRVYARAPRPLDADARRDLIARTGQVEQGERPAAAPTVTGKLIRNIFGLRQAARPRRAVRGRHLARRAGREPLPLVSDEAGRTPRLAGLRCSRPASRSAT
jgi:hypothetical protein